MINMSTERPLSRQESASQDLFLSRTKSPAVNVAETTVLPIDDRSPPTVVDERPDDPAAPQWPRSTIYLILLCAFLTSLSFGVTQVPMLYVFRLMTCDAYYEEHAEQSIGRVAPWNRSSSSSRSPMLSYYDALPSLFSQTAPGAIDSADRCSLHAIDSATALSIALLSASTTVFGLINLFIATHLIKRIGLKPTLLIQVFFPALRLLVQNVGVEVWGSVGIVVVQCSQVVSILGGPIGYILVLNTFVTEVVEFEGRTTALGRLAGAMMAGTAVGFLVGGVVADGFGIKAPFRLTLALFLVCCAYVMVFLPRIPPAKGKVEDVDALGGRKRIGIFKKYFGPLAVFAPKKFVGRDCVVRTEYGAFLLAWGVFLGILANGKPFFAYPCAYRGLT